MIKSYVIAFVGILFFIAGGLFFWWGRQNSLSLPSHKQQVQESSVPEMVAPIVKGAASPSKTVAIDMQLVLDLADDKVLMGASHNVFVGKVTNQIGTIEVPFDGRLTIPVTQYAVNVIMNVKGNLQGSVVVEQAGGYRNNVLYVVHSGDTFGPSNGNNNYLLQPGSTYLFAARYENGKYFLWSYPTALSLISQDGTLSAGQLRALAESDKRTAQLTFAYPREIPWSFDVRDNNARNSYRSSVNSSSITSPTSTMSSSTSQ